jgi:hypothetical protein
MHPGESLDARAARHLLCAVVALLSINLGTMPVVAQSTKESDIAGAWVLDLERSDDARRKLQESLQPDGGAAARGRRGRGGAGGVILGGRGGARGDRMTGAPPGFLEDWIEAAPALTLEQADGTVTIQRDGRAPLELITDDRERAIETDDPAAPIIRKARWDKGKLVIETKLGKAMKIEEKYEVRADGELRIETKIGGDRVPREVKFRRVYTRGTSDPG